MSYVGLSPTEHLPVLLYVRGYTDYDVIEEAIRLSGFTITEVVSGTAKGVDSLGEDYAESRGLPVKKFPADRDHLGKGAGYRRNEQMAEYADQLIAIWDGKSLGTKHMIDIAGDKHLLIFTHCPYLESLYGF